MSYGNIWHDCMSPYTCNPISLLMTNRFRHHKPANQQPTCWSFNWPADHRSLDQHYISIIRSMHAWKRTMYVLEEIDLPLQRESNCLGLKLRSNLGWCPSSTTQEVQIPEDQYCSLECWCISWEREYWGSICNPIETTVITQLPWAWVVYRMCMICLMRGCSILS